MSAGYGALPDSLIHQMIDASAITGGLHECVQPASLDLRLSDEVYRVGSVFYPEPGEAVPSASSHVSPEKYDFSRPLEVGVTYLARLQEELDLPEEVYGYANPKSSCGRCDCHVRLLANGIPGFDSIGQRGYKGSIWTLITPRSFRILFHPEDSLLQVRFFNQDTRVRTNLELELLYRRQCLLFTHGGEKIPFDDVRGRDLGHEEGALILTLDLDQDLVGFRCERSDRVLDWSKENYYEPLDFFQPMYRPGNGHIVLRRGDFYILSTKERIMVPSGFAVEMKDITTRFGDHRAHYAGFFDPGWGLGPDEELNGAPAVMEVRSLQDDVTYRHGRPICRMSYERMIKPPDVLYGASSSHYFRQVGPRLSKHFKQLTL